MAEYPHEVIEPERVTYWARVLDEVAYQDLIEALVIWGKTDTRGYFPRPGQLLDIADDVRRDRIERSVPMISGGDTPPAPVWSTVQVGALTWRYRVMHVSGDPDGCSWVARLTRSDVELSGREADCVTAFRAMTAEIGRASRLMDSISPPLSQRALTAILRDTRWAS